MNKDLDYYMRLSYKIEIVEDKEDGGYALRCPELPGCITCAETVDSGMVMIEDAKKCWFAACIEDNISIPEPNNTHDYSGQFKLRVPKSLHKMLAEHAKQEGISMNQYCVYLLSSKISNPIQTKLPPPKEGGFANGGLNHHPQVSAKAD